MSELILRTIQNSPLFKHLSDEWLNHLEESATLLEFSAGDALIEEGTNADSLLLIAEGQIKVFTNAFGKIVDLKTLNPGDYVGEVSLLSGKAATATVEAVSDVKVVSIGRVALVKVVENDETLRKALEGITLQRAKDTLGKVLQ